MKITGKKTLLRVFLPTGRGHQKRSCDDKNNNGHGDNNWRKFSVILFKGNKQRAEFPLPKGEFNECIEL